MSTTRGHAYKLYKPRSSNSKVRVIFFVPSCKRWNSLPDSVTFVSLRGFKCGLTVDFSRMFSLLWLKGSCY